MCIRPASQTILYFRNRCLFWVVIFNPVSWLMCHGSLAVRDLAALEAKTLFTLEVCRGEQLAHQVLHSLGTILQRGWDVKLDWADWEPQASLHRPMFMFRSWWGTRRNNFKVVLWKGALRPDPTCKLRLFRKSAIPLGWRWSSIVNMLSFSIKTLQVGKTSKHK